MSQLVTQQKIAALYYATLGQKPAHSEFNASANNIELGTNSYSGYVAGLLTSAQGVALYANQTDSYVISHIYTQVYGSAPSSAALSSILASGGSLADKVTALVFNLSDYVGFDSGIQAQQLAFDTVVKGALFVGDGAAYGDGGSAVRGLGYVLGIVANTNQIIQWGTGVNNGTITLQDIAGQFIIQRPDLANATDSNFVKSAFNYGYLRDPSSAELNQYLTELGSGASRAKIVTEIFNSLKGSVASADLVAQDKFLKASPTYSDGQLPSQLIQEQVASVYLAIPERGVDASGLSANSKAIAKGTNDFKGFINLALNSPEFQSYVGQLTGNAFIQYVFKAVHGVDATLAQLATYGALGTDKAAVTQAIINDLRTSTATDNQTVTQQHAYEASIGTSLLYKTYATLTASAASSNGNATGTVNTGTSHVLSNAETAVLAQVVLNANQATTVNLKFADKLTDLTVNGSAGTTVNLSNNGAIAGVNITLNNANTQLNASSGNDNVLVSSTANVANATGKFALGAGNDTLKWLGNATTNGNTVSQTLTADGGTGVDTISANFLTKRIETTGTLFKSTQITTNVNQFTNFEKIDLAGYIGKSVATDRGAAVPTVANTFDYGIVNGKATAETVNGPGTISQGAVSTNLGTQGFVLSGLANAVKVINISGANAAQLEVTGNATSASQLNFSFLENAAAKFDINFTAKSSSNVDAGTIGINSTSSLLLPTALSTININSGGTGDFSNVLKLAGANSIVQTINVSGDHVLNLNATSDFSNVRTIDASGNTAGFNLVTDHGGTGDGLIVQLLELLPLGGILTGILAPLLTTLGLNGYSLDVKGSQGNDSYKVVGNTAITGGAGNNTYDVTGSTTKSGVTINDFNYNKDTIIAGGYKFSKDAGGTIADYGVRPSDVVVGLLGGLVTGLVGGVTGLLSSILGLSTGSLKSKVGIASVVYGGVDNSYIIIDNNNNGTLDDGDTVFYLKGQNHKALIDSLHYSPVAVTVNGINEQVVSHDFAAA